MDTLMVILRMMSDLMTGGDPTLPVGHNELIPVARLFALIYDTILTFVGR